MKRYRYFLGPARWLRAATLLATLLPAAVRTPALAYPGSSLALAALARTPAPDGPNRQIGPPVINTFSANPGGLGQLVTLTGTDLDNVRTLLVNGVAATASITNNTATSLTFRVPLTAPATGTTTVTTDIGSGTSTAFTIMPAPGNALALDGTNDYVALPSTAPVPVGNTSYTVEAWIKPTVMAAGNIIGWGNYGTNNQVTTLNLSATGLSNRWWGNDLVLTTADLTGRWHHVAASYDGTARVLYLDGVEIGRDAPGPHAVPTADNLRLGSTDTGEFFNGSLDEVRVWSLARTAAQVQADMRAVPTAPQAGLALYFNLDQGTPGGTNIGKTTVYDLANNVAGTVINSDLSGTTSNWVESYALVVPATTAATSRTATGFVANWTPSAVGTADSYVVEVATSNTFGTLVGSTPRTITAPALSLAITGLAPSTTYYYRVRADKASVTGQGAYSNVSTVATPSNISTLSNLVLSAGPIDPTFAPGTTAYTFTLPTGVNSTTVTPTAGEPNETIRVNGVTLASGKPSPILILNDATNLITVEVTAEDGTTKTTYTVTVTNNCPLQAVAKNVNVTLGADGKATVRYQDVENGSTSGCGIATYGIQRVLGTVKNEGDFVALIAPRGLVFTDVLFASYGTSSYNPNDASFSATGCQAANSLAIVSDAFLGKNSGIVQANSTFIQSNGESFGDPCPNTAKNLTVQITYTPEPEVVYTCADLGVNRIVLTVFDVNGNKSTAQALVTVSQPPPAATTTWTGNENIDWNNCLNWSYGQVPTATTNAVIPSGLPNYPELISGTQAAVKDLTLANGASFGVSPAATLTINGDWTNNGATTNLNGTVIFAGSPAIQTVGGSASTTFGTLQIAKDATSSVQLANDIAVNSALMLGSGTLLTNSYQATLSTTATILETESSYVTGNVGTTRPLAANATETFGGMGLSLSPASGSTDPGNTRVVRTTGTALTGVGTSQSIARYFNINPTVNTGLDVTMVFNYFTHELNSIPVENLRLFKSTTTTSGPWEPMSYTSASTNAVTRAGLTDFSIWTLGNSANPLPVSLLRFDAAASGATVALSWGTAAEAGSARFEAERSLDGVSFSRIGSVAAAGTTTTTHAYHLTDTTLPLGATTLYYRLRQVDLDGSFRYSPVRTVAVAAGSLTLYPNPALAAASTTLAGAPAGAAVQVLDALGRTVRHATADAAGTAQLVLTGLPSGVYVVRADAQAIRLLVK
jgi:hypothetical protein